MEIDSTPETTPLRLATADFDEELRESVSRGPGCAEEPGEPGGRIRAIFDEIAQ